MWFLGHKVSCQNAQAWLGWRRLVVGVCRYLGFSFNWLFFVDTCFGWFILVRFGSYLW